MNRRAMTLVEVLVASVVFLGTVVLFVGFATAGHRTVYCSGNRVRASSAARAELERLLYRERAGVLPSVVSEAASPPTSEELKDPFWLDTGAGGRRSHEIAAVDGLPGGRRLVVRVRWKESGQEMLEELVTLRAPTLSVKF